MLVAVQSSVTFSRVATTASFIHGETKRECLGVNWVVPVREGTLRLVLYAGEEDLGSRTHCSSSALVWRGLYSSECCEYTQSVFSPARRSYVVHLSIAGCVLLVPMDALFCEHWPQLMFGSLHTYSYYC